MIEKIAADIATRIVNEVLAKQQFIVPAIPDHHHNGTDSSTLGIEALDMFLPLPATGDGNPNHAGVVNPALLGNQSVAQGSVLVGYGSNAVATNQSNKGVFTTAPIPVIYGQGVGSSSAFNGGQAPIGTVVMFTNNGVLSLSGLYVKTIFGWLGVQANLIA